MGSDVGADNLPGRGWLEEGVLVVRRAIRSSVLAEGIAPPSVMAGAG